MGASHVEGETRPAAIAQNLYVTQQGLPLLCYRYLTRKRRGKGGRMGEGSREGEVGREGR